MKKYLPIFACLLVLLVALPCHGFLFDSPTNTATNTAYQTETLAFQTRVLADGGTIVSLTDIDTAIVWAKANSLYTSVLQWFSPQFGYKDEQGGGKVRLWYDLSPNNNDAGAAGRETQPTWTANQKNGKAGIIFSGTNMSLQHLYSATGNTTMVAVAEGDAGGQTDPRCIYAIQSGAVPIKAIYARSSSDLWGTYMNSAKYSSYSVYGTWRIMINLDDGISSNPSTNYLYTDGNAVETVTDTARLSNNIDRRGIGVGNINDSEYFKGTIAELMTFNKQLSTGEIAALRLYLNGQWAVY